MLKRLMNVLSLFVGLISILILYFVSDKFISVVLVAIFFGIVLGVNYVLFNKITLWNNQDSNKKSNEVDLDLTDGEVRLKRHQYTYYFFHVLFGLFIIYLLLEYLPKIQHDSMTTIEWVVLISVGIISSFIFDIWKKRWLKKDWEMRMGVVSEILTESVDK